MLAHIRSGTFLVPLIVCLFVSACDGSDPLSTDGTDTTDGGTSDGGTGGGNSGGGGSGGGSNPGFSISGTPPQSILQNQFFIFVPIVNNPDDLDLTFSAINLPDWASLDPSNGRIIGQPDASDVGLYTGIQFSVSDGVNSYASATYSIEVVATATGTATLSWLPPTEKTDGSPLLDLAGYNVYWGTVQNDLSNSARIDNPGVTSYVIDELTPATWYFAATAFDMSGVESDFSNLASKTIE